MEYNNVMSNTHSPIQRNSFQGSTGLMIGGAKGQNSSELSYKDTGGSFHQYADDTQLHIGTNSSTLATQVSTLESCTIKVNDWLLHNGLHLNPSKSEAIAFFNPRSKPLATLADSIKSISVAGSPIKLQSSIKSLGV